MSKKKKLIIGSVLVLLVLGVIIGICTYISTHVNDSEWGITLKLYNSSPRGATFELIREDEDSDWELSTGESYGIEKWTPFGWKNVNGTFTFLAIGYSVTEQYSKTWSVDWEAQCGKLPIGLYRILKGVTVHDYHRDDADGNRNLELIYYAPFFVGSWWEIVLTVAIIVILILAIWILCRFGILIKLKNLIMTKKKLSATILVGALVVLIVLWQLCIHFSMEIASLRYNYEVSLYEVTSERIEGSVRYDGDDNDETKKYLIENRLFYLEKLTLLGWEKLTCYDGEWLVDLGSIAEGESGDFVIYWPRGYEELPSGTYRIKQPCYIRQEGKGAVRDGNIYVTFTVED